MVRNRTVIALAAAGCIALAGCGSSKEDRTASGAGIGAGAGAVVGAVTGLSILEGVLIGAVAGGLAGLLTDEGTIDLGPPIWADKDTDPNQSAVGRVQIGLERLGYNVGPADGVLGPKTEAAIRKYQTDNDLLVDGRPTKELAEHIDKQLQVAQK